MTAGGVAGLALQIGGLMVRDVELTHINGGSSTDGGNTFTKWAAFPSSINIGGNIAVRAKLLPRIIEFISLAAAGVNQKALPKIAAPGRPHIKCF